MADQSRLKQQHDQCEEWKSQALKSPFVRFMVDAMTRSGCRVDERYFRCVPCVEQVGGGLYYDDKGHTSVVLCENRLVSQDQTTTASVHELIHAFDHCRAEQDIHNLVHHACTEIRAANLSGDCHWRREISRGNFNLVKQHQNCVRRRAILSVSMNPACSSEADAAAAVDTAWEVCFADTAPFERIP
uniref:Mitochondrial inner membrane protease ATP23 n=1 Tax=Spongospora subterranea TaxID=70186 RepID=A0A0H5RBT5_9EUKA|eukprot:CRZ11067.1 hypothetical protein [Spongospora subterranea]